MIVSRAELLVTVLVYVVSLGLAALSNVWLSVWGRRLSVLNSYFRSHQPLRGDEDSVRIDPFDLAALEATLSLSASTSHAANAAQPTDLDRSTINPSPVFDLGLHFLPHIHCRWLPDAFVFLLLPLLLAALFLPAAARYRRRSDYNQYWPPVVARVCCFLQSHSLVLLMRSTTTLATVHRASPVCHALSLESSSNPGFVLNTGCFDLMFSGHTAFCVLAAFFVCMRPEMSWPGQALIALLSVAGGVSNVVAGDHFTADCLVAAHLAILVACLFRNKFNQSFALNAAAAPVALQQTVSGTERTQTASFLQHPTQSARCASRYKEAASLAEWMDVDEPNLTRQDAQQSAALLLNDGMEVESGEDVRASSDASRFLQASLARDECVEEKELQQLIGRWQLADSHNGATAAKRYTRRRSDIR